MSYLPQAHVGDSMPKFVAPTVEADLYANRDFESKGVVNVASWLRCYRGDTSLLTSRS